MISCNYIEHGSPKHGTLNRMLSLYDYGTLNRTLSLWNMVPYVEHGVSKTFYFK